MVADFKLGEGETASFVVGRLEPEGGCEVLLSEAEANELVTSCVEYWRRWLSQNDIAHTADPTADYDVLFVNSFMVPYDLIAGVKRARPNLVVVQRVDGSARDYGRFDDADDRHRECDVPVGHRSRRDAGAVRVQSCQ